MEIGDWVDIKKEFKKGKTTMVGRIENIFPKSKEMIINMGDIGQVYLTVPINQFKKIK